MLIKEAIERAKQAGWKSVEYAYWVTHPKEERTDEPRYSTRMFLDINFWHALCGDEWKKRMRAFTDHLIDEGDFESFFAEMR